MNAIRSAYDPKSRARLLALSLLTGLAASLLAVFWLRQAGSVPNPIGRVAPATLSHTAPKPSLPTGLSARLPPSFRAITVAVDPISGLGGFAQPGDHVDILATFDRANQSVETRTVVQNIPLLALGTRKSGTEEAKAADLTSATLQVTPWQSEKVAFAAAHGHLTLSLRPDGDRDEVALPPEKTEPEEVKVQVKPIIVRQTAPFVKITPRPVMQGRAAAPRPLAPAVPTPKEETVLIIRGTETQRVQVSP